MPSQGTDKPWRGRQPSCPDFRKATLSDGDLRKSILKGSNIGDTIKNVYQQQPTVLIEGKYSHQEAKKIFLKYKFDLLPVIDQKKQVVDVLLWEKLFKRRHEC